VPSQILWASEASWLSATITGDTSQRKLIELLEDDNLMAGAKVVYFVYNDINPANIETLLMTHIAMPTDSLLFSKICDKYGRRRSKWAGDTMKFVERLVGRFVHEWHEHPQNAKQEFSALSGEARQEFWMAQWEKDEAGLAKEMWSPVANVIDWESIYGTPPTSRTQEDRTKLEAVQLMLTVKFLFACEQVFQYRFNDGLLPGLDQDTSVGQSGFVAVSPSSEPGNRANEY
jgi:hypothetical protein